MTHINIYGNAKCNKGGNEAKASIEERIDKARGVNWKIHSASSNQGYVIKIFLFSK